MGNYNFEGSPEGEWEDRGDVSWNEFDWQQFLLRQQKEIARFVALYDRLLDEPDHLDRVAQEMGWERNDWSIGDLDGDDDDESSSALDDEMGADSDPYTLHRHPVFIVAAGLYMQLRYLWDVALTTFGDALKARHVWRVANSLGQGERHMIMTIQAVDMGDYLLGVCHAKMALRAINDGLSQLDPLENHSDEGIKFAHACRVRLFDLREVCLRVMQDCREEDRRGFRESDG